MANGKRNGNGRRSPVEKERTEFKGLLAANPNYFGTFPECGLKAVSKLRANTRYEELLSVGLYPELDLLIAIVNLKLPHGYQGSLCTGGSYEYVRFFIDWDGDGDFGDPGEDAGIAAVNVHDFFDLETIGPGEMRPLSYALGLKVSSQRKLCNVPRLVKVRAILSWEDPPPEGSPDFPVVWGNVLEKWIQVRPARYRLKDILNHHDLRKLRLDATMVDTDIPISRPVSLSPDKLEKLYSREDVPAHRYNFHAINEIVRIVRKYPSRLAVLKRDPRFTAVEQSVLTLLKPKPSIKYEELRYVGLSYEPAQLVANLTIKLPVGYNGDLCTEGSYEYVAFWLQVHDGIEPCCRWQYVGTTCVNVHDIKPIPVGGLQYAVYLPVDLSFLKQQSGKQIVVRVRAVLSWHDRPDPADPEQLPAWGNRVETLILVKPDKWGKAGGARPLVWTVGNMAVENISGNSATRITSSLGDGYANGVAAAGGFIAEESPFGGMIAVSGKITLPPDMPASADRLMYRVQYRKTGGVWRNMVDNFTVRLRINGIPSGPLEQSPDEDGYYRYLEDIQGATALPRVEVLDNILAIWRTPVTDGDGLYTLRILVHAPGASPRQGVPPEHAASDEVSVMIDNAAPLAMISLAEGGCPHIATGKKVSGSFSAADRHFWRYAISVQPSSGPHPPTVSQAAGQYPVLAAPGLTNASFTLTTGKDTSPRGYVLHVSAWNRTIVNNSFPGNQAQADVGFCLVDTEE
ncbi:MAG: hypothetical protein C4563_03475 [Desulfobulbus sp.]|nr:MAG: hypothetical protein C4563_03475 [Desulfobulbus sp.]